MSGQRTRRKSADADRHPRSHCGDGERFDGFRDGVDLLTTVGGQTKKQFASGRARWDAAIRTPAEALVTDLGDILRTEISPSIQAVPKTNGSLSPINKDLRFARDTTHPYKDHLLLNFWDGSPKRNAPTLRLRISADTVGFAAGAAFDTQALQRWRTALTSPEGDRLLEAFSELHTRRELRLNEPELKRFPVGHEPNGTERDRLIRHKTFQARFVEPTPDCITTPTFVRWAGSRLAELADIHRWLTTNTQ